MMLLKKTDKTSRTIGYILSIIVDLAMFGFGIWLYKVKGEDQTGFVLGGILCGVCLLCLLGRYWQNKEADKRDGRRLMKRRDFVFGSDVVAVVALRAIRPYHLFPSGRVL